MTYSMVELIGEKRDGSALDPDAIEWIIEQYTADEIPDYQMSSLLMAILIQGMEDTELAAWTDAMLRSGDQLDLSGVKKPKIDKHSTGGVGDKISIPLAPIVAACGIAVPMMSGRGLGHTGGTLDKLESIPGFSTAVDPDEIAAQLDEIGVVMTGQSESLVPADRRIYALRDASGTVPCKNLISSSIMSKKLAEDLDGLVLDVKVGSGAFMKTRAHAEALARTMIGIGRSYDTQVTALLTDMSQPLGRAVGNANEVRESVEILRGEGPDDSTTLTEILAIEMLVLAGEDDREAARSRVASAVSTGAAMEVMVELVRRQGGDPRAIEDPTRLPQPPSEHVITAQRDGFVVRCDALSIGEASVRLGAGRATKGDDIDPAVGLEIEAKIGVHVTEGTILARVGYRDSGQLESALSVLQDAWVIADEPVEQPDLVLDVIT
ncbi:MAG TPA: thymidine phosphorylase [Acidimicrobiia bacterium]|nr:thymidine phosphorylase [Acidimicrobiia bacterium]